MRPLVTPALLAAALLLAAARPAPVANQSAQPQGTQPQGAQPQGTQPQGGQPQGTRALGAQPVSATVSNPAAPDTGERIVAVVNGDVISQADVAARGRLFALSTGLPATPDVIARLRPQVTRELVDEKLRLQEEQRRKVVVTDKEIANAIGSIEQRNNMPVGSLVQKLGSEGVALRTLYDQTRVQIGWTRVLRDELGPRAEISEADVAAQMTMLKSQAGQPEYQLSEIFLPIEDPSKTADISHFADSVIAQLRTGAPFPVVAAQFSQSQSALQGGDMGWVGLKQIDPQVAEVLRDMPEGAISNPITVPGGIMIVTLRGKREVGRDMATILTLRQVFLPFSTPLNPSAPTDQQKKQLAEADAVGKSAHTCEAMETAAKASGSSRPSDPGEVRLEGLSGPMRALLTPMQPNQPSRPLISIDGIGVVMVCTREQKNIAEASKQEIANRVLNERVELVSRQLVRDMRRRASIDQRS